MKNLYIIILFLTLIGCKKSEDGTVEVIPLAPTELKATIVSKDQVDLTWKDNSTNETGYKIERKTDSGNFTEIGSTAADVTIFSDKTVSVNTNYTYRVYGFNQVGKSIQYSNEANIRTINFPALNTVVITDISSNGAKSGGNVSSDGNSSITARGVVWSINSNPTIALSTKTSDGTGTGSFQSAITGLSLNTTYYVRAYATNNAGTSYGNEISFKTLSIDISTGLMGFYPFNGNANDESGNGNNGKIADAILTTDRFGNTDKAYSFNGTSSRIVTTKIPDLSGKITMAAWFNTQSLASWGTIIDCRTSTSAGVGIEHNNKVSFTTSIGGSYSLFYSNYTIPTNTWIHVATVFNGSQKLIYINGELDKSQSYSTPLLVTTEPFVLGDRGVIPSGAGNYFKGKLDDIRIYNTALTAEQIKFLYNINQ
jgi:hypothetical protein